MRTRSILLLLGCLACMFNADLADAQYLTSAPHRGVVQVPIGNEVYAYLRHMTVRGLIKGYSENELPISEFEIAEFVKSADRSRMTPAEIALQQKFIRTFAHDPAHAVTMFPADSATPLFVKGIPTDEDKYLYRWWDTASQSDLFVNGIASIELRDQKLPEPGNVLLTVGGGQFHGTLSGHVGYFLEATNGQSHGDSLIALEDPSLASNKNFAIFSKNNFDFTSAELSYNNDWFTAKLAREAVSVGGSYQQDNVILSSNVPFYDFVSVGAHVGVVRYQAMVASLLGEARFSEGYDTVFHTYYGAGAKIDSKYLTLHDLSFTINDNIELGFTDMVVYSRRFDLAYLNPFSFLKSVETSLNDRDNGILGAHARWKIVDGFEVRGEGVVDDVVASLIGKGYWSNKFAWQYGFMWSNPLGIADLDLMAEGTRIEPYTFSHFNQQNTFSSSTTLLSNHIGPNSISYWFSARWAPSEKWTLQLESQFIERGENLYDSTGALIENHGANYEYSIGIKGNTNIPTHILDGRRVNITTFTAILQYELWRGLFLFGRATDKIVNYHDPNPNPIERPQSLFAFGAKALF